MNKINKLALVIFFLSFTVFSQTIQKGLVETSSFFPNAKGLEKEGIKWYYLVVPENWDNNNKNYIKLAVAVVKAKSKKSAASPILYIAGGPGDSAVNSLGYWLDSPLRSESDIVLIDVRGTGNSIPTLCPDLGAKFLEILSKNQESQKDEQEKVMAALSCKQDIISRGIDIKAYNSNSIAKDFNFLKKELGYNNWNVYSVSYGTYIAQVYANNFEADIKSLILDSAISDISNYYNENTSNYSSSLQKMFDSCEKDPNCNQKFPNLEQKYYETIEKLRKKPLTVHLNNNLTQTNSFTYNAEDFKVAIQQVLYNKQLVELLPQLITEFNQGNENTLASLVESFSQLLSLDYGLYYCVSCNEVLPTNSIQKFNNDAANFPKMKGGLSFYKSDFKVCTKWNEGTRNTTNTEFVNLNNLKAPVLIFSGGFDPITPIKNAEVIHNKLKNSKIVYLRSFGHASSFTDEGGKFVKQFIENPSSVINTNEIKTEDKLVFKTNITVNQGVPKFANNINEPDLIFLSAFAIAFFIVLLSIFTLIFHLIKSKYSTADRIIRIMIVVTSCVGISQVIGLVLALNNTVNENFYILAFGLNKQFDYLFKLQQLFLVLTILSLVYYFIKIKKITNEIVIFTILFSMILINLYFFYWGFFK